MYVSPRHRPEGADQRRMVRSLAALTRRVVSAEAIVSLDAPPADAKGRASMASTASECPDRMAVQFRVAVSNSRICGRHTREHDGPLATGQDLGCQHIVHQSMLNALQVTSSQ